MFLAAPARRRGSGPPPIACCATPPRSRSGAADCPGLRELAPERAQVLASAGEWAAAAGAWREALGRGGPYAGAAVFSLQGAPDSLRAAVAGALLAPPAAPDARRAAATLLLGWRRPREAWAALAALPRTAPRAPRGGTSPSSSRRRGVGAGPGRVDPRVRDRPGRRRRRRRASRRRRRPRRGDPAAALALVERTAARAPGAADVELALVRVRALGRLGRPADAERAAAAAPAADADDRAQLAAAVAGVWVARGDLARARSALAAGGPGAARTATSGWLALYAGDLRGARALLRRTPDDADDAASGDRDAALTALTVLGRARADSVPAVGAAFLALAQGDSARAAAAFERAAAAAPDAAPPLLLAAARLRQARREGAAAEALWARVLAAHAAAPEAAEAELAWARALLARGDRAGARARLEHLIVTFAESALAPVARRELDALGPA
jgi:tetratricopeptide (TPR) repeat protein